MNPRHAALRTRVPVHATHQGAHLVRRAVALVMTAVLGFAVTGAATAYTRLQNNITSADVDRLLGDVRPPEPTPDPTDPNAGTPVNILVLGSDTRAGNEDIAADDVDGGRSDTTILMHVSADRSRVEMVSIPRDSLVDIPECLRSDGTSSPPQSQAMFNSAFMIGSQSGEVSDGAACVQKTVEAATGVYVHHFVVIDMSGFVNMVDAIGGVPMCIPQDMYSRKARLDLAAGDHVLDGQTALALARARTGQGLGDGSDLGRIARQQELLAATARTVLGMNLLTDVPELIRFLNATTRSLTVSSGLGSIPDMAGFGYSLRDLSLEDITFVTVPNAPSPIDPNRVVWTAEADDVWARIAADVPVSGAEADADDGAADGTGADQDAADEGAEPGTPTPARTPGVEPFTPADIATVCG